MIQFNKNRENKNSPSISDINWSEMEVYLDENNDSSIYNYKGQKRSNIIKVVLKVLLAMVLNSSCLWLLSAMLGYFPILIFIGYLLLHMIPIAVYCRNYDYNFYLKSIQ